MQRVLRIQSVEYFNTDREAQWASELVFENGSEIYMEHAYVGILLQLCWIQIQFTNTFWKLLVVIISTFSLET